MKKTNNLRVSSFKTVISPAELLRKLPLTEKAKDTVVTGREEIEAILEGRDERKIVVVGPCSIHDAASALEYAQKLAELKEKVKDRFVIVMRCFFEKPRTTIGWKGYVYDPFLDNSDRLEDGLFMARDLLLKVNEMGLPTATEVLGATVIQYYADLISWSAIGARTSESQIHRELASGLSMPVGFKNGTQGNLDVAINAIVSAQNPHNFLGIDDEGRVAIVGTKGNTSCHLILRGGQNGPNFGLNEVMAAAEECKKSGLEPKILVDCSHANSQKDFKKQSDVFRAVMEQIDGGQEALKGLMIESNLFEGSQKIGDGKYGVSVTDACIGFEETERLLTSHVRGE